MCTCCGRSLGKPTYGLISVMVKTALPVAIEMAPAVVMKTVPYMAEEKAPAVAMKKGPFVAMNTATSQSPITGQVRKAEVL
jgi:hypothetical protein